MAERYAAFISYSHRDAAVAAWLQRALEGYRVPPYIVGRPGAFGAVPPRIGAVFRDREDLPASADLAASVRAALTASDALIAICSPDAARSRWVDAEIALFKAQGGGERVFALIVGGEPFASDSPGREDEECLPLALRRHVGADGVVSDRVAEPMAADMRHESDGRRLARSKIVAGLLGIPLDMLVRREHARRQRGWAALAAASMLGTVAMGGLALEARSARDAARARRTDAEQLVEFMLGDLRKRLDAVGRLDVLDSVGAETMRYYARQDLASLNADELARRARALRLVGELRSMRGDFAPAAAAFREAAATTGELMAREPGSGQRVFDHAQSVFWVGNIAQQRGDWKSAAHAFDDYVRLADRLIAIDPTRDEWRAEVGYSLGNRGMLEYRNRSIAPAARDFARAMRMWSDVSGRHPANTGWKEDYADSIAWFADAKRAEGDLNAAFDARQRELAIYLQLTRADPQNFPHAQFEAWTQNALGQLEMDRGNVASAIGYFQTAASTMARLLKIEPDNVETMARAAAVLIDLADAYVAEQRETEAGAALASARSLSTRLIARDASVPRWHEGIAETDLLAARLAVAHGDRRAAGWLAMNALEALNGLPKNAAREGAFPIWRARALAIIAGLDPATPAKWQAVIDVFGGADGAVRLDEQCLLGTAYAKLGRGVAASAIARDIVSRGYRNPDCALAAPVPVPVPVLVGAGAGAGANTVWQPAPDVRAQ